MKTIIIAVSLLTLTAFGQVNLASPDDQQYPPDRQTTFRVRIENISSTDGQIASDGTRWPFALSPGLWIVHTKNAPLFSHGKKDRGKGIEAQAEEGNPELLAKGLATKKTNSGIFNIPVGADQPGPILPGNAYEFTFEAAPGARLSIVTMFGQSNDLFYAPDEKGIPLFEEGQAVKGDITSQFILWDAGTEMNQEPGLGPHQAPRQKAPNTGASESKPIETVNDSFSYPRTSEVLRITITPLQQSAT